MGVIEIRYSARCKDCKHLESYHRTKKNGEPYRNSSYRPLFFSQAAFKSAKNANL